MARRLTGREVAPTEPCDSGRCRAGTGDTAETPEVARCSPCWPGGLSDEAIGRELFVSATTARFHVGNAVLWLAVSRCAEAVHVGSALGLVQPERHAADTQAAVHDALAAVHYP